MFRLYSNRLQNISLNTKIKGEVFNFFKFLIFKIKLK